MRFQIEPGHLATEKPSIIVERTGPGRIQFPAKVVTFGQTRAEKLFTLIGLGFRLQPLGEMEDSK